MYKVYIGAKRRRELRCVWCTRFFFVVHVCVWGCVQSQPVLFFLLVNCMYDDSVGLYCDLVDW